MRFGKKRMLILAMVIILSWCEWNGLPNTPAQAAEQAPLLRYGLQNSPILRKTTVYYPLKEMAALLDLHVAWNRTTGQIEVTGVTKAVKLSAGSQKAAVSLPGKNAEQSKDLGAGYYQPK